LNTLPLLSDHRNATPSNIRWTVVVVSVIIATSATPTITGILMEIKSTPFNTISLMRLLKDEDIQAHLERLIDAKVHLILDERDKSKLPQGSPAARAQAIQERNTSIAEFVRQGKSRQEVAAMFSLSLDRVNQIMRNFTTVTTNFPKPKPKETPEQKAARRKLLAEWGGDEEWDDIEDLIENKMSVQIFTDIWNGESPADVAKRYNVTVKQAENCYFHEEKKRK